MFEIIHPELKTYLDSCRKSGIPFTSLSDQLVRSGWSAEEIARAREYYISLPPPPGELTASRPFTFFDFVRTMLVMAVVLIILTGIMGVLGYLVAVEKISLDNPQLKARISEIIFSLDFVPKTPKYVFQKTVSSASGLTRAQIDLSLAAVSESFQPEFGTSRLDLGIKGYVNYSDPANPFLSLSLTTGSDRKETFADIRKNSETTYLRLLRVPAPLPRILNLPLSDLTFRVNSWAALSGIDYSPNLPDLADREADIVPALSLGNEFIRDMPVYRLDFNPDSSRLADLGLDEFNSLKMNIWVDTGSYFIRRVHAEYSFTRGETGDPVEVVLDLVNTELNQTSPVVVPDRAPAWDVILPAFRSLPFLPPW